MPVARSVGIDLSYDEAYRSGVEYMLKRSYALLAAYYNMPSASACGKYPLCPVPLVLSCQSIPRGLDWQLVCLGGSEGVAGVLIILSMRPASSTGFSKHPSSSQVTAALVIPAA